MIDERIAEIIARLRLGITSLSSNLPRIFDDPRAYPREAMLLAVLATLLVTVVLFVGYAVYDEIQTRRTRQRMGLSVRRRGRLIALAPALLFAMVVAGALSISPLIPAVGQACGICHAVADEVERWEQGTHASVSCYGCHAAPGISGAVSASWAGIANVVNSPDAVDARAHVYDAGCLGCHDKLRRGVTGTAVNMRHADVIDAGLPCVTCHDRVAHESLPGEGEAAASGSGVRLTRHRMSICLTCHDGVVASSDCDVCHQGRPLDRASTVEGGVTVLEMTCSGCHESDTTRRCIACHGLELPHPVVFMRQHAGMSARDPGLCARCHESASARQGCACHTEVNTHGTYSAWFPVHGPAASSTGPGGCNCHRPSFCGKCHDTSPF